MLTVSIWTNAQEIEKDRKVVTEGNQFNELWMAIGLCFMTKSRSAAFEPKKCNLQQHFDIIHEAKPIKKKLQEEH